jgi:microcystin-dependent protein
VIAYAGILTDSALQGLGWWVCRGQSLEAESYPDLFSAIGTLNGGDGANFTLPDYQGRFLRGVDEGSGHDPDAEKRVPPGEGGSYGDVVGSVQEYATANANNGFSTSVWAPSELDDQDDSDGTNMAVWDGPLNISSSGGGDAETRPVNAYVNFLIKVQPTAEILPGSVIPVAGPDFESPDLLLCDGTSYPSSGSYQTLFNAIRSAWGSTQSDFNVPDLRGRFLRGVDNGTGRDPDAGSRTAANPGGATGDNVGSIQGWATAPPVIPFTIYDGDLTVPNELQDCGDVEGYNNAQWNSDGVTINFTSSGGDDETRPVNVYVDWFICQVETQPGDPDPFPIGGVIGFAGDIESVTPPPSANFLECTGQAVSSQDYPALVTAIGTANGGEGTTTIDLPDYRGRFLRGVDHGAGNDPDSSERLQPQPGTGTSGDNVGSYQGYSTAQPVNTTGITGTANIPVDDEENSAVGSTYNICRWSGDAVTLSVAGGDAESRPINVYCSWFIRYA